MTKEEYLQSLSRGPSSERQKINPYKAKLLQLIGAMKSNDIEKEAELSKNLTPYEVKELYSNAGNVAMLNRGITSKDIVEGTEMPSGTSLPDLSLKYGLKEASNFTGEPYYPGPPLAPSENVQPMDRPRYIETKVVPVGDGLVRAGYYDPPTNIMYSTKNDPATTMHEMSHAMDEAVGFNSVEPIDMPERQKYIKQTGLPNALNYFEGHNKESDLVNRANLYNAIHGLPFYSNEQNLTVGGVVEPESKTAELYRNFLDVKKHYTEKDLLNR